MAGQTTHKSEKKISAGTSAPLPEWFPLDNAATIYPAAKSLNWNCVYRLAVILKEDVKPDILKQALDSMVPRFPSFFVKLRSGFFWYYLERTNNSDVVAPEEDYPCRAMTLVNTDKPAFRVTYFKRRIGLEVFHSLADGGAGLCFLKTLTAQYLELLGAHIEKTDGVLDVSDPPSPDELEDNFKKNYEKKKGLSRKEENSFQYVPPKVIPNYLNVIHGLVPVEDVKHVTKTYGISITEYLTALLIYGVYKTLDKPSKKPIKISVPVSLRPIFDSKTLRNFSLFTNFGIQADRMDYTFDEVVAEISGKLKAGISKDILKDNISKNVGDAKMPLVRFIPNVVKTPVLKAAFYVSGQKKVVTSLTNLGNIAVPESMKAYIDRFEVLLGGSPVQHLSAAICSFDNLLNITLTADTKSKTVQRIFFSTMAEHGIRVRIECNDESGVTA